MDLERVNPIRIPDTTHWIIGSIRNPYSVRYSRSIVRVNPIRIPDVTLWIGSDIVNQTRIPDTTLLIKLGYIQSGFRIQLFRSS